MKIRLPKELLDKQAGDTSEEDSVDFSCAPVFPTREMGEMMQKLSDTEMTALEHLLKSCGADGDISTREEEAALERALILHAWSFR
jgi:hypothetical protein